ncbi:protein phosphatase 2C domain-containing protein [Bosea sp. BK604]|uniref:PP2C family protein-serine/threonine phosphatase n=1 Tax=Bosea sp. BK604 TaxID=2512180 RepID=UPI00104C9657|nr:protein phosphatase 2C domain-containing protein [Bosea sp. BK604]TCR64166.1 protein phosphatase/serine/threonine-protein phosphatase Stp1 [Bosea sp. BK604]
MTAPLIWDVSSATMQGPNHDDNQDAYAAWPEAGLFVVADGMGGHTDGGLASRSIVEILQTVLEPGVELTVRVALAEEAIEAVNTALREKADTLPSRDIIGSTVVALLVGDDLAVSLWVGDSRIYHFSQGRLRRLTRDHTLAEDSDVTEGNLNVLTRAVGSTRHVEIERLVTEVAAGDTLLVCSDGLTKALSEEEIASFLAEPLPGLAERLVARAVVSGGRDDTTAVVARCR